METVAQYQLILWEKCPETGASSVVDVIGIEPNTRAWKNLREFWNTRKADRRGLDVHILNEKGELMARCCEAHLLIGKHGGAEAAFEV